jgi:hypothetical protein
MYLHHPLLTPFFQTRWLPFRLAIGLESSDALTPMKIKGCEVGPFVSQDTELDYDSFALELEECESGSTDESVVAFTGPAKVLATSRDHYGLCSTDPIALTRVPSGLEPGDRCGVVDGAISADGSGFIFLCYTSSELGLVRRAPASAGLVELCAQETATRNTPYEALLGTWDPSSGLWCYDDATTVTAIDHRYGMPLAESGFKGLYQAMPSSVEGHDGTLYVCVSLDCEEPPEGCNECGGA